MPIAVIYVRVSTEEQAREGVSLAAQTDICISYCQQNNFDIAAILTEEGESAYSIPLAQRTKGQELLTLISEGAITDIVSYQLDRLFRNDLEAISYARQWMAAGVSLHFAGGSGEADIGSALGEAFYGFQAIIARMSSRQTSERVSSSMDKKAREGLFPSKAPYGYRCAACVLTIVGEEAAIVRQVYEDFNSGMSILGITRKLNSAGVPSSTGSTWRHSSIKYLLNNPVYIGLVPWNDNLYQGQHEPLLDKATYDKSRRKFALRQKAGHIVLNDKPVQRMQRATAITAIYTCGYCKSRLRRITSNGKEETVYMCARCHGLPKEQRHRYYCFSVSRADTIVWHEVAKLLKPANLRKVASSMAHEQSRFDSRVTELQGRLIEIDATLERTINMVRDGYPADLIQKSNAPLIEERKVIEAELVRIESLASAPNLDIFKGINTRAFLRELQAGSSEEQLDFLWQVYSHVELLHNRMIFHYIHSFPALEVELPRYIKRCGKSLL